jgi:hypothetical protein
MLHKRCGPFKVLLGFAQVARHLNRGNLQGSTRLAVAEGFLHRLIMRRSQADNLPDIKCDHSSGLTTIHVGSAAMISKSRLAAMSWQGQYTVRGCCCSGECVV